MNILSFRHRTLFVFVFGVLVSSVASAAIDFTVPASVDDGEGYSVVAVSPPTGPGPYPTVRIYKNGVKVAEGQTGVGYGTSDTGPATVTWLATSTNAPSVTKTTTVLAPANTAPIGSFDSLTASVTEGKTIYANGWAADNEMGSPITRVDVYLDGVDVANATLGGVRADVANAYGRSDYTNSGWSWSFNTSGLSHTTHSVEVKLVDAQGLVTTKGPKTFTVSTSKPATTLSAADTTIYTGQSAHLTSVTTDPGSELTTHYMDYLAPGSSTWVLYSPNWASSGNSYWSGSQSPSHTMSVYKTLNTAGTWQFRSQGRDSANRYSSYKYVNVTVSTTPPVTSISVDDSSVIEGDTVTITASASDAMSDLTQVYIDQKQPGGSWEVSKYSWSGSARSSCSFPKSLPLSVPGTWQFRARGRDAQGVYGSYSATKSVSVASITSTSDYDGDGLPDWWERLFSYMGLDPNDANDADADFDGDEVSNKDEFTDASNDPLNHDPESWFVSPPFNGTIPSGASILIVEPDGTTRGVEMPELKAQ